ncbi:hypothetical protein M758_12G030000 [Ceratodon purpureus]|nr:hypothetical protein M758_12G030000 [Ceratodon purpureus]
MQFEWLILAFVVFRSCCMSPFNLIGKTGTLCWLTISKLQVFVQNREALVHKAAADA